ncbi:peptidoglycan-binding protein [Streptomyces fractus]|uniref:peptidoglycan-binding protein n=1 Tax=Streptomyces fractus TaxID=641806 RepID=UPI003CE8AA77
MLPTPSFYELDVTETCSCAGCGVAPASAVPPLQPGRARSWAVAAGAGLALVTPTAASAAPAAPAAVAATTSGTDNSMPSQSLSLTGDQIIARAMTWVDAGIPYSQSDYYHGYRTDCSGFVSMAWGLNTNAWTGNLTNYASSISESQLQPGDVLLSQSAGHVVIFDGWANSSHTQYYAIEESGDNGAVKHAIPYPYYSSTTGYMPYRYDNLITGSTPDDTGGDHPFPGSQYFGPGESNEYVTELGEQLVANGYGSYYTSGPGPTWTQSADGDATQAFQEAQGWTGSDADGIPGPTTWTLLQEGASSDTPDDTGGDHPFPGSQYFGPGESNEYVTELGEQLVANGYGSYYTSGPGPTWTQSADGDATQAFQEAQGWTGSAADGIPGPQTWALLFS